MQSSAIDQTLQEPGIRFDAAKLNWIGNPTVDNLGHDRVPRMPDGRPNFTAQDRTISPVPTTNGW